MTQDAVPTSPVREAERILLTAFLTIRGLVLATGFLLVAFSSGQGSKPYRYEWLAGVGVGIAAAASTWVAAISLPRRSMNAKAVWIDVVACLAVLVAFERALEANQIAGSADWAISFTYTVLLGIAVARPSLTFGLLTTLGLAIVIVVGRGFWMALDVLNGHYAPSFGLLRDLLSIVIYLFGFYVAAYFIQRKVRQWASRQEEEESLRREIERSLAGEQERNRQHRLIHDTVLQTLEAIGAGMLRPDEARNRAKAEAARLRQVLRGEGSSENNVDGALAALVNESAVDGLRVEMTTDEAVHVLHSDSVTAIAMASREALTNVRRHAGVSWVVMNIAAHDGGCRVVIRDRGVGFDPARVGDGFGVTNSIVGRMRDVGGWAEVWSEPGRGTRVTLWVPR